MGVCIIMIIMLQSIVFGPETLSLVFVMVLCHFQAIEIEVLYTVALILTLN